MTLEERVEFVRAVIDEDNYPFFPYQSTWFLLEQEIDTLQVCRDLALKKSQIPAIKLGDVSIESPQEYFMNIYRSLLNKELTEDGKIVDKRGGGFKCKVRADGT